MLRQRFVKKQQYSMIVQVLYGIQEREQLHRVEAVKNNYFGKIKF